jgi:uridine kinase
MDRLPIILISGGSCSGKTVFAGFFRNALVLGMDKFFFGKHDVPEELPDEFDHPNFYNLKGCADAARSLSEGKPTVVPKTDATHSGIIGEETLTVASDTQFVIVEGIFAFYEPLRQLGNLKIYLDTPREIRVSRRMIRDVAKGRTDVETMAWSVNAEKSHDMYVDPMKQYADLVIPFSYNPVVCDFTLKKPPQLP